MGVAVTLSLYIARLFTLSVLGMIAALTGLVGLFDLIDLLRRASTREDVGFALVAQIAALHVPYYAIEIMPFGVLLGGIVCFWRLTRSSELIVARAAGISAWQFLAAPLASAMLLGIIFTGVISPVSSAMYSRAEQLDRTWLRSTGGPLATSGGQLWLRQLDHGLVPDGVAIVHARQVRLEGKSLYVTGASVFRLDGADRLLSRIESPRAALEGGQWVLHDASTIAPDSLPVHVGTIELPTDLTVRRVQESFASPDTLSVWALPGFIRLLDRSGFSSVRHRLHFQSLLALPLLASTMSLVAAGFSMRPARRGGVAQMIGSGLVAGFALFTVSKVAEQFGESGALPAIMAAWAPTGAGLLLAVALLLHLEDG
ncbi:lipopolysaccharide export system permease protein [Endobacter medicaginis]|jgi:lipopolysaccharide export system permease protein|uniref:LPS export ABC transporter permease LptG n=1 Tax=Endobacter medicaginis TaxID=1181271 RepID=A0A850NPK9_9PROT|nr:LPS export ABC transporter permease LptG [Endobacter medicaginis]MBB3174220.1 lipopolysaccharide export system permease protein [Endobacter medicaginis]MCX5474264.1 LPS export ABC transporter permease LptG [Endobacter medicaginis]NVN31483.1 LPS export ABC transporter permease LptG [Endobacter medicaginis]